MVRGAETHPVVLPVHIDTDLSGNVRLGSSVNTLTMLLAAHNLVGLWPCDKCHYRAAYDAQRTASIRLELDS